MREEDGRWQRQKEWRLAIGSYPRWLGIGTMTKTIRIWGGERTSFQKRESNMLIIDSTAFVEFIQRPSRFILVSYTIDHAMKGWFFI